MDCVCGAIRSEAVLENEKLSVGLMIQISIKRSVSDLSEDA